MTHLKEGAKAPGFSAINENGETLNLSNYSGKKLILYFYPKDNTPTCTTEACNLRDNFELLQSHGFELLGVSPDSQRKHQNFIKKFDLPFSLLVDADTKIAEDYGVWGEKQMFGKKYMGVFRTTFVIDENGVIEKVFTKVKSAEHAAQILDAMQLA